MGSFTDKLFLADLASGEVAPKLTVPGNINAVSYGQNTDTILVATNKKTLLVYSAGALKTTHNLSEEAFSLTVTGSTVFAGLKNGKLVSLTVSEACEVSQNFEKDVLANLKVTTLQVAPCGKILGFGAQNGTLGFFDLEKQEVIVNDLKYHSMPILSISFNKDSSQCITSGYEKTVRLWDVSAKKHLNKINDADKIAVNQSVFVGDQVFTFGYSGAIKLFQL